MYDPDYYDNDDDPRWIASCGAILIVLTVLGLFLWLFVESQDLTAWECRETPSTTEP